MPIVTAHKIVDMLRLVCLIIFCTFFCLVSVSAQYDDLINKSYSERVVQLNQLYGELVTIKDSVMLAQKVDEIRKSARSNHDRELELEMGLFTAYHNTFFTNASPQERVAGLNQIIALADQKDVKHIKIRGLRILANYYFNHLKNYEMAFEQYLVMDKELATLSAEEYPDMAQELLAIGEAYYFFQDYTRSKYYLEKAVGLKETAFNTRAVNSAKNTLGLCYQKEGDFDKANRYFYNVLQTPFPESKAIWERIVKGNIGTSYYMQKEYDEAIPLLEIDYKGAEIVNDFGPAAGALILLGDIFFEKGDASRSWNYLVTARKYISNARQPQRLQYLFPVMSKWYSAKGNTVLSKMYLDSTVIAINAYHENFNSIKVLRAQQRVIRKEEELRKAEIEIEERRKAKERAIMIAIISLLCMLIATGYVLTKRRQRARDLKLQIATRELAQFTESISEKNFLIEKLLNNRSEEDRNRLIQELQQRSILTEEDWTTFQRLFEKAHSGFIQRLKVSFPTLTQAEIRLLVLTKLSMNTKEMAGMLGVGSDTIRQHRSRVRKKLGISDEIGLESVLND